MESLSSIFQSPLLAALISPILAAGGLLFFLFRVGSLHSLLERLWRLVAGKAEVENPQLKKLIQENRDLERFRFIYGLNIETQSEFQRLMSWLHRHRVGIARLQRVRKWVDIRSPHLVLKPPRRYVLGQFAMMMTAYLAASLSVAALFIDDAYLRARGSDVLFKTDGTAISGFWGSPSAMLNGCLSDPGVLAREFKFSAAEATTLCKMFEDKSLRKLSAQAIHEQRVAAGVLGGLAALITLVSALKLKAAAAARELWDELQPEARASA